MPDGLFANSLSMESQPPPATLPSEGQPLAGSSNSGSTSTGAAFFGGAQHVHIHASQFNTTVTQPRNESTNRTPNAHSQAQQQPFTARRLASLPPTRPSNILYQEQMMHKRRGHPLWFPQVSMSLPAEFRSKGFSIGDVGNYTPDGGFDFLFNILLPADHPINDSEVPEGFVPLDSFNQRNVREYWEFEAGTYLASSSVESSQVDMDGMTFQSTASEGAVLTMPHGAQKVDLSNTTTFQKYMSKYSESWYKFVNGPSCGRNLSNGELHLVYGGDKSTSWGIATFSNISYPSNFHLKFCKSRSPTDGATSTPISDYTWEHSGMADAMRIGPGVHDREGLEAYGNEPLRNQTLFLRTMAVTLGDDAWKALNSSIPAHQRVREIPTPGWGSAFSLPGTMSAAAAVGGPFVFMLFKGISGGMGMSLGSTKSGEAASTVQEPTSDGDDVQPRVIIENSDVTGIPHPSTIINKILLHLHPNARVAITTDAAWLDLLPSDWKLMTIDSFTDRLQIKERAAIIGDTVYLDPLHGSALPKYHLMNHMHVNGMVLSVLGVVDNSELSEVPHTGVVGGKGKETNIDTPVLGPSARQMDAQISTSSRKVSEKLRDRGKLPDIGSSTLSSVVRHVDNPAEVRKFERMNDPADISNTIKYYQDALAMLPEGHPEILIQLDNLARSFSRRFQETGDLSDINIVVEHYQRAISLIAEGHPDLPGYLTSLGVVLYHRFQKTGDTSDILSAIEHEERAVGLTTEGHPDMPRCCANLGFSLHSRFERTGDLDDISVAIKYKQKAVMLTPEDDPDMPERLADLGASYRSRFNRMGDINDIATAINLGAIRQSRFEQSKDLDDISAAIKRGGKAVVLTPESHFDMPGHLADLGTSFHRRFERTGDLDDIATAIKLALKAVELNLDHPNIPRYLANLGASFHTRFERTGDLGDLASAIEYKHKAVQLTRDGHPDMPEYLANLGSSYLARFVQGGNLDDISIAIELVQKAVKHTPNENPNFSRYLANLGISFHSRFQQTGNLDDISTSIEHQGKSITLSREGHPALPARLANLGTSFQYRFAETHDLSDISTAIESQEKAVTLTPEGHPDLPKYLADLGSSFHSRFEQTADLSDIAAAIRHKERAFLLTPQGHSNVFLHLTALIISLNTRLRQTDDFNDLSTAVKYKAMLVTLLPDSDPYLPVHLANLGISYYRIFEKTKDPSDIEAAVNHLNKAILLAPADTSDLSLYHAALADSLRAHSDQTGDIADLSTAIEHQHKSVSLTPPDHPNLPLRIRSLGELLAKRYERTMNPDDNSNALKYLGQADSFAR